jgi:hypothetical protein
MKRFIEQEKINERTSRAILHPRDFWERQLLRRAWTPVLMQMAEEGKISFWYGLRSAKDLALKTENLCKQQEERIRKEGRVVMNQEVFEMACEEFDREEAKAQSRAEFRRAVRSLLVFSREKNKK